MVMERTGKMEEQTPELQKSPGIPKEEAEQLKPILERFIEGYKAKASGASDEEWLFQCYQKELPERTGEELAELVKDTLSSVAEYDRNLKEVECAAKQGISAEKWFASAVKKASAGVGVNEYAARLAAIDTVLTNGNAQMLRTVTTQSGEISGCYNLDGFIAEQHHVNTFNANAALKNADLIAEVQVPGPGETYGKNSFDLVVKDGKTGRILQQYQAKYGATAQDTIKLLRGGNYQNQRLLVPTEQVAEVQKAFPGKTVTSVIGGDELGVASDPLTKQGAKTMQLQVQESGEIPQIDYNTFETKKLALHIGQNAGLIGLQSAALAVGVTAIAGAVTGEGIDSDTVIETALTTGADAGVKAAAAGAIKVGAEKGVLSLIPPGTPVHVIANIACVGIENVKILAQAASGELTTKEALDKMGRTSVSMVFGLGWGATAGAVGTAALLWVPIVGPIVGGLAGGMIGYMAGSKFGGMVYNGAKKIVTKAKSAVRGAWEGVKSVGRQISNGVRRVVGGVKSFFKRL